MKKQLVVNADDFGLTESITKGTIKAIEEGMVTSVSLVANGRDFEQACEYLATRPHISVGWHINLTTHQPVCMQAAGPGLFSGKTALLKALAFGRLDFDKIQSELYAQWQRLQTTGLSVTHIDSHHDVHAWPRLGPLLAEFIQACAIPFVRFCGAELYPAPVVAGIKHRIDFEITRRLLAGNPAKNIACYDVDFIQFRELYQLENKKNVVLSYIDQLGPGVTELICHPGFEDKNNKDKLLYNAHRQLELDALRDCACKQLIKEKQVELKSFRDLGDGTEKEK